MTEILRSSETPIPGRPHLSSSGAKPLAVSQFDCGSVPGWNVDYPHCIFLGWPRSPTHVCLKSR